MQELKLGNYRLVQYTIEEYAKEFDGDVTEERYAGVTHVAWLEELGEAGEVMAMSVEVMYIYEDNTFAYTCRHLTCKASFEKCIKVLSWIEKF